MIAAIIAFVGFIALICVLAWDKYVIPKRMTSPPVGRILELISSRELGVYDNPPQEDQDSCRHFVDYVIFDSDRKVKTYLYRDQFSGSPIISGDLDWRNRWEQDRVLRLVESICGGRKKAYQEACAIEKKARDERRREEAKKVYQYR